MQRGAITLSRPTYITFAYFEYFFNPIRRREFLELRERRNVTDLEFYKVNLCYYI